MPHIASRMSGKSPTVSHFEPYPLTRPSAVPVRRNAVGQFRVHDRRGNHRYRDEHQWIPLTHFAFLRVCPEA